MMARTRAFGMALLAGTAACTDGSDVTAGTSSFTVRDSAGIEIVESRAPVWGEGEGWTIDPNPLLQIGAVDGEDSYLFSSIADAVRLVDGRMALVEWRTREVRVFDAEGRFLYKFGRRGEGPAEFAAAPVLQSVSPATILVWDPRLLRFSWFGPDGALVREESIAPTRILDNGARMPAPGEWRISSGAALLAVPGIGRPGGGEEGLINGTQLALYIREEDRSPVSLGSYETSQTATANQSIAYNDFHPRLLYDLDPVGGGAVVVYSDRWEVRVHDRTGAVRRAIRVHIPLEPLTIEMLDTAWSEIRERVEATGRGASDVRAAWDRLQFSDSLPSASALLVDAEGNLWIQRWHRGLGRGSGHFEVIAPDGRWLGAVTISPELGAIEYIGGDRILTEWRDDLGVSYLRVYRIVKGG